MSLVLTLTADPATAALEDSIVARVREALAAEGGAPSPARWLAPRIACDIALPQGSRAAVADIARRALGGAPVDIAASVAIGRRKTLLVADMESTLIENEMLDELAAKAGIGDQVAAITRRTMNGELDFEASFRERIAMLRGAPARWLDEAKARIRVVSGATTLVRTMRAHGARVAIVSGGLRTFTRHVQTLLGADEEHGNEIEIVDGKLTGRPRGPILGRDAKLATLRRLTEQMRLDASASLAVGDGANDVPMLSAAGLGIAFRAKPAVAAAAPIRIDHGDLTALLYVQGYSADEFAS
ncbi:MAG TPA: phosphoserine phosphatase SerB [Alphaproteobacteria bacterium]|nr:phosphoserine phosphatase SerB [Alphaproteobacteria bacterium]